MIMDRYMNKALSPEERADDLIKRMSLEEKMGQIVSYFPRNTSYEELYKNYSCGAGQVSCIEMRGLESFEEIVGMQKEIQEIIMSLSEHHIPSIFHMEGLCGALVKGATSFPNGIGRASSWDEDLEKEVGKVIGKQACALGVSHVFAPVLDISRDSRFGRQGETYGEDPTLASAMGVALIKGIHDGEANQRKSEAVAKHFLGFHAAQGGIHSANCDIPEKQLRELYAKPFQAAITEAGLKGVMPSYNLLDGVPVSCSKDILTGLLREEMGFEGVTVSDYAGIKEIYQRHKICGSLAEAGKRALEAGMDMELQSKRCYNEELMWYFASGKLDIAILNRAVKRVLTAKFRMGLFENPFALPVEEVKRLFHQPDDGEIALQSALESMVLIKNDGTLPIDKSVKRIAVIGYHAATVRAMFGGYSHFSMTEGLLGAENTMAGMDKSSEELAAKREKYSGSFVRKEDPMIEKLEDLARKLQPDMRSLLEQLRLSLPDTEISYSYGYPFVGDDMSYHDEALEKARNADLVILTLGGKNGAGSMSSMGEGIDSTDINLPICQETFIKKVSELNKPVVAIHFDGRPISSDAADQHVNSILEVWNPSEKGPDAITAVLLGDYNPGGKLPVSVAFNAGQIPIYYNHMNGSGYHQGTTSAFTNSYVDRTHAPRYFFGHGLSYTEFQYLNLQISEKKLAPEETLIVSVEIKNIGKMQGNEVVQLYVKDRYASVARPVMELAGFKRVNLQPGEKKKVTFMMVLSQIAFLDCDMKWKIEAGDLDVLVGSSSEDIRIQGNFEITEDLYVDGKSRKFYAKTIVN